MTPKEAIEIIWERHMDFKDYFSRFDGCPDGYDFKLDQAILTAVQALEEIQQYREINTEIKQIFDGQLGLIDVLKGYIEDIKRTHNGKNPRKIIALSDEDADKWESYKKIGTVEECREAVGKQKLKNPVKDKYHHNCCPNCGWIVSGEGGYGEEFCPHCENCGQAIQWDENLEGMEDENT